MMTGRLPEVRIILSIRIPLAIVLSLLLASSLTMATSGCTGRREKTVKSPELGDADLDRIMASSAKTMKDVTSFKCRAREIEVDGDDTTSTTKQFAWQDSGRFYEKDSTGREYYLLGDIVYAHETTAEPWQMMVIPSSEKYRYRPEKRLPIMPIQISNDLKQSQNLTYLGEEKIGNRKCWIINFIFRASTEKGRLRSAETVWISQKDHLVMKFERTWRRSLIEHGSLQVIYSDHNQSFRIDIPAEINIQE